MIKGFSCSGRLPSPSPSKVSDLHPGIKALPTLSCLFPLILHRYFPYINHLHIKSSLGVYFSEVPNRAAKASLASAATPELDGYVPGWDPTFVVKGRRWPTIALRSDLACCFFLQITFYSHTARTLSLAVLSLAVSVLQRQGRMVSMETIWPAKPRIFTIWPFIGRVCQ